MLTDRDLRVGSLDHAARSPQGRSPRSPYRAMVAISISRVPYPGQAG
jgi:hypothetical protein